MSEARIVKAAGVPLPDHTTAEILKSYDGALLRLVHFGGSGRRGDALIVPGWAEPSEKYGEVALDLIDRGFRVHAMDPRGQGLSQRMTDLDERGRIDDIEKYVRDLTFVVSHLAPERLVLIGHSMGGLTVLGYLSGGGRADCAVLSAPATRIFPALWQRAGVRLAMRGMKALGLGDNPLSKEGGQAMSFEGNTLTSDPERHRYLRDLLLADDALRLPRTHPHMVLALDRFQRRLMEDGRLSSLTVPIHIVSPQSDTWVDPGHHRQVVAKAPGRITLTEVPGARHELLMERDEYRDQFWDAFDQHTADHLPPLSSASA